MILGSRGHYAFIYCTKWRSGQVSQMPYGRTDGLTLKDSATQLLIKYKSGALVTQWVLFVFVFAHCWKLLYIKLCGVHDRLHCSSAIKLSPQSPPPASLAHVTSSQVRILHEDDDNGEEEGEDEGGVDDEKDSLQSSSSLQGLSTMSSQFFRVSILLITTKFSRRERLNSKAFLTCVWILWRALGDLTDFHPRLNRTRLKMKISGQV